MARNLLVDDGWPEGLDFDSLGVGDAFIDSDGDLVLVADDGGEGRIFVCLDPEGDGEFFRMDETSITVQRMLSKVTITVE